MATQFKTITPGVRLSVQVAEALSAKIRTSRMVDGDRLPTEAALVSQFAVSRTVVREAVSRLKSLGLVESRQGSGVFVKSTAFSPLHFDAGSAHSKQAVIQMVEVRRALETEVAALAAGRRTKADIKHIQQAISALDKAVKAGGDGVEEDMSYHRAIADAAHNPFLIKTLDDLRQFLQGTTRVTRANEAHRADLVRQVQREHEAIAQAITLGDAAKAGRAAARHMNNAIQRIGQANPAFWQQEGVQLASTLIAGVPRR